MVYEANLAYLFIHQKFIEIILYASGMLRIWNSVVGKVDTNLSLLSIETKGEKTKKNTLID